MKKLIFTLLSMLIFFQLKAYSISPAEQQTINAKVIKLDKIAIKNSDTSLVEAMVQDSLDQKISIADSGQFLFKTDVISADSISGIVTDTAEWSNISNIPTLVYDSSSFALSKDVNDSLDLKLSKEDTEIVQDMALTDQLLPKANYYVRYCSTDTEFLTALNSVYCNKIYLMANFILNQETYVVNGDKYVELLGADWQITKSLKFISNLSIGAYPAPNLYFTNSNVILLYNTTLTIGNQTEKSKVKLHIKNLQGTSGTNYIKTSSEWDTLYYYTYDNIYIDTNSGLIQRYIWDKEDRAEEYNFEEADWNEESGQYVITLYHDYKKDAIMYNCYELVGSLYKNAIIEFQIVDDSRVTIISNSPFNGKLVIKSVE